MLGVLLTVIRRCQDARSRGSDTQSVLERGGADVGFSVAALARLSILLELVDTVSSRSHRVSLRIDPGARWPSRSGARCRWSKRTDAAGATHEFLDYLTARRLSYSLGFALSEVMATAIDAIPDHAWTPAYDADRQVRQGAWVAEATGVADLSGWPAGMRLIVRKERPHPGAQLRFTDRDGLRLTAFVTNTRCGQLPDLELRHRRRARCEDRIRVAKDTGLANLPLNGFDQNRIWCALVQLAMDLTAWLQMLAFDEHPARRWEPKRLRLRLFSIAGRLARHAHRTRLRLAAHAPWVDLLTTALARLQPG